LRLIAALCLSASFAATAAAQEAVTASSPDGRLTLSVYANERGEPTYEVRRDGEPVIEPSRLGFRFADHERFENGLTVSLAGRDSRDETWEQPWGERRVVRDRHEEVLVTLADAEDERRRLNVRFRLFDDGVGFRYEAPKQRGLRGQVEITDELTEFAIPAADTTAWWIPARDWNRYEYLYEETPLGEVPMAHTPITLELGRGTHLAIHEAALVDYSGMSLDLKRGNILEADLAPWSDGVKVKTEAPFETPWRVVQVADDAAGLANGTDIYLNLNDPNALGDVSFVEPGKYAGMWWQMHVRTNSWGSGPLHGATTENVKEVIDFAAETGLSGVLVEGWNVGWDGDWYHNGDVFSFTESYPDFDLKEVTDYAASKGVRLIGHHETSGNVTNYERQMEDAFDLYERHGVTQVKTGYVADAGNIKRLEKDGTARFEYHDGQFMANHHVRVLKEAAERGISINAHEPIKDTGLRRTYPNALAREGARGQEYDAWGVPPNPPEHTAIIPFTRMLSGPMDFTPGTFDLRPNEDPEGPRVEPPNSPKSRVETTLAKQLALYVVLYSPVQMVSDLPENYGDHPEAFRFIRDVPTDWEESVTLAGEVGDYVVTARQERGGEDWYLGAVTDEEAREVTVPLSFLGEGRTYEAQVYADGPGADYDTNPYPVSVTSEEVTGGDGTLTLRLAPGGGTAIRFRAL
jgi:alpha-glucosidase